MKISFEIKKAMVAPILAMLGLPEEKVEKFLKESDDSSFEVTKEDLDGLGGEFSGQLSVVIGVVLAYKYAQREDL